MDSKSTETTPEDVGIPSEKILQLLEQLERQGLPMHALAIMRYGKPAAEAYWEPFNKDSLHRAYSISKSFASVAIGILAGDRKLALSDCVIDYFPEYKNCDVHPCIARTTVENLLEMRTPFARGSYMHYADWTKAFFTMEADHPPGTFFRYDTLASVMLGMLVQRLTGMETTEFLRERLFIPAGMREDIQCIQTPCGHDWMGSGILCSARDLLRFGQVCMQSGMFNGKQLIPGDFMRRAVSVRVDNRVGGVWPEHSLGYGYQFWRTPHGFACRGMGSQLVLCVPEADLIVVTLADTQSILPGDTLIMNAVWDMLLPALSDEPLPENPEATRALTAYTAGLSLTPVAGNTTSSAAVQVAGREYVMAQNSMGIKKMHFAFEAESGEWFYENATGTHSLRFGFGKQIRQEFPETHYFGRTMMKSAGKGYDCHASAAWADDNTLVLCCYTTDDYLGTLKISFSFHENELTVYSTKYAEMFFDEYEGIATGCMTPGK
ncbi:MAG: serine hydrolase [Kiritimatiellales bacterium]